MEHYCVKQHRAVSLMDTGHAWHRSLGTPCALVWGLTSETSAFWLVCAGPVLTPSSLGSWRQGG